jgi:hypothetical protein
MAENSDREEDPEMTEDEISNAETQDFQEQTAEPQPQGESSEAHATDDTPVLSDADVDRIARRLLELAGDRIERIAWDVIPDMAEIVVRERVRELEAESGTEPN